MKPRDPPEPHEALREAVGGARVIGGVQILMGCALFCLFAFSTEFGAGAAVFLIAPGVLQQVAANLLKRRESQAASLAVNTMFVQSAAVLLMIAVHLVFGLHESLVVPAAANVFLMPAMLAQTWKIAAARRALRLLPARTQGFEVSGPRPVIAPIAQPVEPIQSPIDSDREK